MGKADPNRREEILRAALRVFAQRGLHQATIKEIASEASLKSGALIYWYFKDKDELFHNVLMELSPLVREISNPAGLMGRPPEEVLPLIARTFFGTFEDPDVQRLFRIFVSEAVRAPEAASYFIERSFVKAWDFLAEYLRRQTELGRLRQHDCESSASAFMGALLTYVLGREIFPQVVGRQPSPERYLEEACRIFLDGLRPRSPRESGGAERAR